MDNYYYSGTASSALASDPSLAIALGILSSIAWLIFIVYVLQIVAWWKIFTKAGEKGWKSLIPIYNYVVLFRISGVSPLLLLTVFACIIPFIGWLVFLGVLIYQTYNFAKSFGKGVGTTILLLINPISTIVYLVIGLGSTEYVGPGGNTNTNVDTNTEA